MKTELKLIAAVALGFGMAASTASAWDIGGFATTNSGGKTLAADGYESNWDRSDRYRPAPYSMETTGSISSNGSKVRRPVNCPPRPVPGTLQTQGGNSGTTINSACPDY
ncbi:MULTISPECIES: hypothetical protein [unclassified Rhizobium]|uniref:hypothetical protein n=1 Tax=unclassified Rhizobium TaxID=2613769 RepID=UPI00160A0C28|nr:MULTISPECIES: hypothetical protein [unclassified Rhizobium]MBB3542605.1 hypothetical protein [Rhizobium sp. BK399]MCS3739404.1 hypothetical protein [Rhizobium sp. BK661]MCS4091413.1 hypothetical protein [Rhizobium sp. BK176]